MVVLVTGASGFIGRQVLALLDGEVHGTFTNSNAGLEDKAIWHRADLLDTTIMRELLAHVRPSHLIHLAWNVPPGKYWTSQENVRWLTASLDLLIEFARAGGKRAVVSGTCAEYSWTGHGLLQEDQTPTVPATLYGASKQALGSVAAQLAKELGITVAHGRIFFPYGPAEHRDRLVPSVILSLLKGQPARCTLGTQIRDFIHAADVARALVALLHSEFAGPVNIGTGKGLAVADLVGLIGQALGRSELIQLGALPTRQGEPHTLIADSGRLTSIGFVPRYSAQEGIEDTIHFWSELGAKK